MRLTEQIVSTRSKHSELHTITRLNVWGSELTDVSIVKHMPAIEILALSVNNISSLRPFRHCKKLRELYLRKNDVRSFDELRYLQDLPDLRQLWLDENPCQIRAGANYRMSVLRILPNLVKLDDKDVSEEERAEALKENELNFIILQDVDENTSEDSCVNPVQVGGGDAGRCSVDIESANEENYNSVDLRSQQQNQERCTPRSARVRGNLEDKHAISSQSTIKADFGYLSYGSVKSEVLSPRLQTGASNVDPCDSHSDNEGSQGIDINGRSFSIDLKETKHQRRRNKEQSDSRHSLVGSGREQSGCSNNNTHRSNGDGTEVSVALQKSRRSTRPTSRPPPSKQFDLNSRPRNCDEVFLEVEETEDFQGRSSGYPSKINCHRGNVQDNNSYEYEDYQIRRTQEFVQKRRSCESGARCSSTQVGVEMSGRYSGGYDGCGEEHPRNMRQQLQQYPCYRDDDRYQRQQQYRQQQQQRQRFDGQNVINAMKLLSGTLSYEELLEFDAYLHNQIDLNRL